MKIAIFGAGSLGTVLGAYLTKNGVDVDLFSHNKNHIEGLRKNGAHIIGKVDFTVPVKAFYPEEMEGKYDLVFLMTKQLDNENVVKFLKEHLTDDGDICTMQNGLPEPQIAEIVGEKRVLGCTVAWGATMTEPGVCELTSSPDSLTFSLGSIFKERGNHFDEVKALLEMMGPVEVDENFVGTRWSKLLINASFSGMSAVLGCTFGEAAKDKESRKIIQKLIKECIDVCAASGIRIEPIQGKDVVKLLDYHNPIKKAISFFIIPIAIRKHAGLKASMLQDIERGKKTEVDAINGAVCAQGRKVNVPTPCNDKVVELIHRIENGELKPGTNLLVQFR